jgi:hypothetical protein
MMNLKPPPIIFVFPLFLFGCATPSIRHLASPVSGTLKIEGVPVEGVKIFRSASSSWYDNLNKEEVTQSSKDGKFSLQGITAISPGGLVHQVGVRIKIWAVVDSKEFVLFEIAKSNYKKFGELTYEKPAGIAEVTQGEKRILLDADIQLDSNQTVE